MTPHTEDENTMDGKLSAGEFEALTGLTSKALRLYAEREILLPASVDPVNAYRFYDRAQVRHGITLDLLRRGQVPLARLAEARDFDYEAWRQRVTVDRLVEDFYLDVAEKISAFDPHDFVIHQKRAEPLAWIGVVIDVEVPSDIDDRVEAFSGLAVDAPRVDRALFEVLTEIGNRPSDVVWTAVPDLPRGGGAMLVARPSNTRLDRRVSESIRDRVMLSTGREVTATAGTLPHRTEVTFSSESLDASDPVVEASMAHLHVLAFEHHCRLRGLAATRATPRQLVRGRFLQDGPPPISVFDAHP